GGKGGDEILVRAHVVDDLPGLDDTGPADAARHAEGALPVRGLLALERRGAAIGPREGLGAVVGGVNDDGIIRDAEVVELLEEASNHLVMLDHAIGIKAQARLAITLLAEVREDVHARRVEVAEERLAGLGLPIHEVERGS